MVLNLHFDILKSQNLLVKIQKFYEEGSVKDKIYNSVKNFLNILNNINFYEIKIFQFFQNPKKTFIQKYPNNTKGKALHISLIANWGRQILQALKYLHSNNFYHLHLHSGNILIEEKTNTIKLTELENFVCNLPTKNEQYFNFIIDDLNYNTNTQNNNNTTQKYQSNNNTNNNLFSDIFKSQYNIFEKIDIISFGRVIYEMTTGKELKSSSPDELELNDMDGDIALVLKVIFSRNIRSNRNNNNFKEISVKDLLGMSLFNTEDALNDKEESKKINFFFNYLLIDDEVSRLNNDISDMNKSGIDNNEQQYCQFVKEKIFDQNRFLEKKNKLLNKF